MQKEELFEYLCEAQINTHRIPRYAREKAYEVIEETESSRELAYLYLKLENLVRQSPKKNAINFLKKLKGRVFCKGVYESGSFSAQRTFLRKISYK